MSFQPAALEVQDIFTMEREQLIETLLAFNDHTTFHFTPGWLKRQWTVRLRTLLLSVHQQYLDFRAAAGQA